MNYIISYGGGINSTALILHVLENNKFNVSEIIFSDTGGEKDGTYNFIKLFNAYIKQKYDHEIITVKDAKETLYDNCLRRNDLPSVAFGRFGMCSNQFKVQPIRKYLKKYNKDYIMLLGITYDEPKRIKDDPYKLYPLFDDAIGQEECVNIIKRHNLPVPEKSSCFFCPNQGMKQIKYLYDNYPTLFEKAVELEDNFIKQRPKDGSSIAGLSRNKKWSDLKKKWDNELYLFNDDDHDDDSESINCFCND